MRNENGIKDHFRDGLPKLVLKLLYAMLALILLLTGSLAIAQPSPVQAAMIWTARSPMVYAAASAGIAVAGNGRVYLFGGSTTPGWAINQEYNPASDTWRTVANMPTGRYSLGGAAGLDGKVYAIGGWRWGSYTGVTEAYDPVTDTWASKASMNYPRQEPAAATGTNGLIYAIGGTYYEPYIALNLVEAYNPVANTWIPKAPMPTPRWWLAAAGASNGKIYAIGGYDGRLGGSLGSGRFDPAGILNTVEEYDPVSNTWTTKAPMPTRRAGLTAVATPDGKIYAIGGFYGSTIFDSSTFFATVEVYDTATDTWTTETPMTTPRLIPRGALVNGTIYVIGGYTPSGWTATVEATGAAPATADTTTSVASSQNPSMYGQSVTFTATVTSSAGTPNGTVQFKIDGSDFGAPVALSGGSATSGATSTLAVGDHTVSAVYSGDANFNGSTSPNFMQTVSKASQTITFGALPDKTYGDADFAVSATATSGLAVTFTASGACTVSGNTIRITGLGSATINAHQGGNGNYNAAPDVSQTFTVNITYDRLGELVKQFVTKQGIVNSLLAKLDNAQKAEAKDNANAKAGMIGAFINEVEAQTGKAISAENANTLIALARAL